MNNIKKSLVMLTLALVCVAGFAATSARQPAPVRSPVAQPMPVTQHPVPAPSPQSLHR